MFWTYNSGNLQFHRYRELVERNKIKVSLSGTWPAVLYDESMIEAGDELAGLFRSETLLRVYLLMAVSPLSLTHSELSVRSRSCVVRLQGENGRILNQGPDHVLQAKESQTLSSMGLSR